MTEEEIKELQGKVTSLEAENKSLGEKLSKLEESKGTLEVELNKVKAEYKEQFEKQSREEQDDKPKDLFDAIIKAK